MSDYYEILGVARSANKAEIKHRYKRLAQKYHPDKGGDVAKFHEIQHAYDVLSDDYRRERYDRGEPEMPQKTRRQFASELCAQMFLDLVCQPGSKINDVIEVMRVKIDQMQRSARAERKKVLDAIRILQDNAKHLRYKGEGQNFLALGVEARVRAYERKAEELNENMLTCNESFEILNEYEWELPPAGEAAYGPERTELFQGDINEYR